MQSQATTTNRQAVTVPADLEAEMDEMISHYPVSKRSASLPLLHLWQNHFGYIDDGGVEWIARKLELQPINILELVTFYPWFRQQAAGKTVIRVCRTLSCAMAGSEDLKNSFCKALKIPTDHAGNGDHGAPEEVSPDGEYSVEFVECLASCGSAPVCLINDDLHENVSETAIPEILSQYKK
ncbi:MAG: NAD(P)H-dependent oxidoreductase subunit E [Chthoniobacterales bacterium]